MLLTIIYIWCLTPVPTACQDQGCHGVSRRYSSFFTRRMCSRDNSASLSPPKALNKSIMCSKMPVRLFLLSAWRQMGNRCLPKWDEYGGVSVWSRDPQTDAWLKGNSLTWWSYNTLVVSPWGDHRSCLSRCGTDSLPSTFHGNFLCLEVQMFDANTSVLEFKPVFYT